MAQASAAYVARWLPQRRCARPSGRQQAWTKPACLSGCLLLATGLHAQTVYKVGIIPQFEARALSAIWTPILSELERQTGLRLDMLGSARIPEFEQEFAAGRYDFVYMNPYHSLVAMRSQNYLPLVRDSGQPLYGILVTAKGGPVRALADLRGQTVAFPAPNALGASLMIRSDLDRVHHIEVKPLWAQTHTSAYLQAALGQTAAAGGVMSTLLQQPQAVRDRLTVIYETRHVAGHPLMVHPRVPAADRERMLRAFLSLGATPQGQLLLSKVPMRQPVAATESEYRELAQWGLEKYYIEGDH